MKQEELKARTKRFAINIIKLVQHLEEHGTCAAKIIADRQMLRSGTGVASNYRAACRCKSRKDFIHKIGTVVEEADETQLWLELLLESDLAKEELIKDLLQESKELTAIMTASRNSAIRNQANE